METNTEEEQLREKLREIEDQKRRKKSLEEVSAIIDIVKNLPNPIAKARLFGEYLGVIPSDITLKDKRDIIEGYITLEMPCQAAILTEHWFKDYERVIELYLTAAQKAKSMQDVKSMVNCAATKIYKNLHDPKRAISLYLEFNYIHTAIFKAVEWGELLTALDIAERHGDFSGARGIAYQLGDKAKVQFYERAERLQQQVASWCK